MTSTQLTTIHWPFAHTVIIVLHVFLLHCSHVCWKPLGSPRFFQAQQIHRPSHHCSIFIDAQIPMSYHVRSRAQIPSFDHHLSSISGFKKKRGSASSSFPGHSQFHFRLNSSKWQCVKTNSTPVVHIKIAGLKWMFIPLKMVFS